MAFVPGVGGGEEGMAYRTKDALGAGDVSNLHDAEGAQRGRHRRRADEKRKMATALVCL